MTANNALFRAFKVRALTTTAGYVTGPTVADLDSETLIKCVLTDNTDTDLDEDTHEDMANVVAAAQVPTPVVMTSTTVVLSSGAVIKFDAGDVTFTSVTGDQCEQVLVYNDSGGDSTTDILICKFGVQSGGLPVTPNGGNIVVQWNASGIFTW